MANRPCKPDADMNRLWQTLLPGTPMPACGVPKDGEAAAHADDKRAPDTAGESQKSRVRSQK
jgi:hypothetical protein